MYKIILSIIPVIVLASEVSHHQFIPQPPDIKIFYAQEMARLDKILNPLKTKIKYDQEFDFFLREYFSKTALGFKLKAEVEWEITNFQTLETIVKLRAASTLLSLLNQRKINNDGLPSLNQQLSDSDQRVQELNVLYDYVTRREFVNYLTPNRLFPMLITKS